MRSVILAIGFSSVQRAANRVISVRLPQCADGPAMPTSASRPHHQYQYVRIFKKGTFAWLPSKKVDHIAHFIFIRRDLPLNFHPAAVRASANVTPFGAVSVPA